MTVSRVLGGKNKEASQSAAARARLIREIATKLRYHPNSAARTIATGRFGCVSLLLASSTGSSSLPPVLLRGIISRLAQREMHLSIAALPDEQLTSEGYIPKVLREWAADGLLINYTDHIPQKMVQLIGEHGLPSVWLNTKMNVDCVRPDDYYAAAHATTYLVEHGHRRIAYADFSHGSESYSTQHYSAGDRYAGYEQSMRTAGLTAQCCRGGGEFRQRIATIKAVLSAQDRPTAFVYYGGETELLFMAAGELGLQVPRDLSLMSFSQEGVATQITSMVKPDGALGHAAVDMLIEKIEHPRQRLPAQALSFRLWEGSTVAPPPA